NDEQGGYGGEEEASDDRAAERRILLAAFAQAESHGQHADDHGDGGHDHGADAGVPGRQRGGASVHAFEALIVGEYHHQDAIGGGHADAHDGAHEGGDAEGGLGEEEH